MTRVLEPKIQRIMCAVMITLSLPCLVSGQQEQRVVNWQPDIKTSDARVLEIVDIKIAGTPITIGQPVVAHEDWLSTLTFRVRNVSGKTMRHFGFGVAFPEIDANGRSPMFSIKNLGGDSVGEGPSTPKLLRPDEEADLKLPEDQLTIIRQISFRHRGSSKLSKVNILSGLVIFEDGTGASAFSLRSQSLEKR